MIINNINKYKRSIREANYSKDNETVIWDFYVTKSLSRASSQHRQITDYHKDDFRRPLNLLSLMLKVARVDEEKCKIVHGKSMNAGLAQLGLLTDQYDAMNIATPRIACLIPYSRYDGADEHSAKNSVLWLMIHTRNALAHGRTYFFSNDFVMLEDLDFDKTLTSRMIFHKDTLLAWIKLFDKEKRYYPEIN